MHAMAMAMAMANDSTPSQYAPIEYHKAYYLFHSIPFICNFNHRHFDRISNSTSPYGMF